MAEIRKYRSVKDRAARDGVCWATAWRRMQREAGLCRDCSDPTDTVTFSRCAACRETQKARTQRRRARQAQDAEAVAC